MISHLLRILAATVAAMSLASVSSCTDRAADHRVGALGPASGETASGDADHDSTSDRSDDDPSPPPPADTDKYPEGYETQNPHHVISPFKPHNLIDISENPKTGKPFVSGNLVKDPSNDQIFRIP